MSSGDNKRIMQAVFAELAKGNGRPFVELMAEDFCWTVTGTTAWSRSYRGKQAVRRELLEPLYAQFAGPYRNTAQRILADEDCVVVECRGQVSTTAGKPYHNSYCFVIRMEGGRMKELTEYLDTQLVAEALAAPTQGGPRPPAHLPVAPQFLIASRAGRGTRGGGHGPPYES